jgi:hypothetical protein
MPEIDPVADFAHLMALRCSIPMRYVDRFGVTPANEPHPHMFILGGGRRRLQRTCPDTPQAGDLQSCLLELALCRIFPSIQFRVLILEDWGLTDRISC